MTKFKKLLLILLVLPIIFATGVLGFYFGKQEGKREVVNSFFLKDAADDAKNLDFSLFWDAWQALRENFVDQTKLDNKKMLYGAISGLAQSLEDPYTVFFNPEENKRFMEDVSGKFEGVGMEIGLKKGQLQVIAPLENTPAQRAGFRAGDKIIKINGTLTNNMTTDEAVKLIRGQKGTEVRITVFRDQWISPKEIKVTRDVIEVPSLKWELKDSGQGDQIAYIKLYQFSEKAGRDFQKATLEILQSPAQKIILDLRNNPGGYLEISRVIASYFLEKDKVVALEDFGGKKERKAYLAEGHPALLSFPLVVLINEGSASAAEILAGALKDNRQIKLIGETSFGKGSVQELKDLAENSALKITVAKWLTPNGQSISEKGLEPDIKVEITDQDYEEEKDPQLDKAIEILNQSTALPQH